MYNDEPQSYIELEQGSYLGDFARQNLLDCLFSYGGKPTALVPAYFTRALADILDLDHGSVLGAAVEEALCSTNLEERAAFFEGLAWWQNNVPHCDLAEMHDRSVSSLEMLELAVESEAEELRRSKPAHTPFTVVGGTST